MNAGSLPVRFSASLKNGVGEEQPITDKIWDDGQQIYRELVDFIKNDERLSLLMSDEFTPTAKLKFYPTAPDNEKSNHFRVDVNTDLLRASFSVGKNPQAFRTNLGEIRYDFIDWLVHAIQKPEDFLARINKPLQTDQSPSYRKLRAMLIAALN